MTRTALRLGLLGLTPALVLVAHASVITLDPFQTANYQAVLPSWVADYNALSDINSRTVSVDFAEIPEDVGVSLFDIQGQYIPISPGLSTGQGYVYSAEVLPDPGASYMLSLISLSPTPLSIDLNEELFGLDPVDPPGPGSFVPEPASFGTLCAGLILLIALYRRRSRIVFVDGVRGPERSAFRGAIALSDPKG